MSASQWGGGTALSSWESLMWRADAGDPRTRSTGVLLERLEEAPDWPRLQAVVGRACSRLRRLRERIVEPPVALVGPRWAEDPEFDLAYHLDRVRLPGEGDDAELRAAVDHIMARPLDRTRPPWRMTLLSGLDDGGAALALQVHHCLSDGQGLIQLLGLLHTTGPTAGTEADTEADTDTGTTDTGTTEAGAHVPQPAGSDIAGTNGVTDVTGLDVLTDGVRSAVAGLPQEIGAAAGAVGRAAVDGVRDPIGTGRAAVRYGASLRRMLTPPDAERGLHSHARGYATLAQTADLGALKAAAKAAGGSLNDAYLAAVLGTWRRHHARHGAAPERLPLAFPISTRTADDPEGGNRFAGVRFAAPVGEPDPRVRIAEIGEFARSARAEPALGFLDLLAPVIGLLPGPALTELSATLTATTDVQASNIPGPPESIRLAGVRVTGLFPFGPRPGIGAMVTMLTYDGTCCLGWTLDPGVVDDVDAFAEDARAGLDEVLALAEKVQR